MLRDRDGVIGDDHRTCGPEQIEWWPPVVETQSARGADFGLLLRGEVRRHTAHASDGAAGIDVMPQHFTDMRGVPKQAFDSGLANANWNAGRAAGSGFWGESPVGGWIIDLRAVQNRVVECRGGSGPAGAARRRLRPGRKASGSTPCSLQMVFIERYILPACRIRIWSWRNWLARNRSGTQNWVSSNWRWRRITELPYPSSRLARRSAELKCEILVLCCNGIVGSSGR